jgi:hypothetical protein
MATAGLFLRKERLKDQPFSIGQIGRVGASVIGLHRGSSFDGASKYYLFAAIYYYFLLFKQPLVQRAGATALVARKASFAPAPL